MSSPLSSRQHLSNDDVVGLEGKQERDQNCSMLYSVLDLCIVICTHTSINQSINQFNCPGTRHRIRHNLHLQVRVKTVLTAAVCWFRFTKLEAGVNKPSDQHATALSALTLSGSAAEIKYSLKSK